MTAVTFSHVGITVPDLDSFYWANPPARQLAYEIWGV